MSSYKYCIRKVCPECRQKKRLSEWYETEEEASEWLALYIEPYFEEEQENIKTSLSLDGFYSGPYGVYELNEKEVIN